MKDMNYVYMSTSMEALCRHVNKNKSQGGLTSPPILDPLEAMILDPWDPLVMWNDDDDGDDQIKNPSANLPCADNLSRHHLGHNSYSKNPQIRSYFDDPLSCCTMQLVYAGFRSGEVSVFLEKVFGERLVL